MKAYHYQNFSIAFQLKRSAIENIIRKQVSEAHCLLTACRQQVVNDKHLRIGRYCLDLHFDDVLREELFMKSIA